MNLIIHTRSFILTCLLFITAISSRAQLFDGDLWVNNSLGPVVRINNILENPSEQVVCTTSAAMGDIGFSPDGKLYAVRLSTHDLRLIDTLTGNDTVIFLLPVSSPNALSFDNLGKAYVGSTIESKVGWIDLNSTPITSGIWHDFGVGNSSGDFIFLKGKMYIAWKVNDHGTDNDYLYEVTVDANHNYISHRSLGKLPSYTYGMSSDGTSQLFCVTRDGRVYSVIPPPDPVTIIPNTLIYTCLQAGFLNGATSKAESFGNSSFDYGDAPDYYPTYDSLAGALHLIKPTIRMGVQVDSENDGQPTPDATGDDNDALGNDDDGVFLGTTPLQDQNLKMGTQAELKIVAQGTGFLNGWMDWNQDGDWADLDEHIFTDTFLNPGTNLLVINVPAGLQEGYSFCRFRFSSMAGLSYSGLAPDGEVEDYRVNLVACISKTLINTDSLNIMRCTCNSQNGAITGLKIIGTNSYTVVWRDSTGTIVGESLNIDSISSGRYLLEVSDSEGCPLPIMEFIVESADSNQLINNVIQQDAICDSNDGYIHIVSPVDLAGRLYYSIDDGNNWYMNQGIFHGVLPGTYQIRVRDSSGCGISWPGNPLIIANQNLLLVKETYTSPETGTNKDGSILIVTIGDSVYSSINGSNTQLGNGLFTGLSAGTYIFHVYSAKGCDTTFTIEVEQIISQKIKVIASDGSSCLGNVAVLPLLADHFSYVSAFESRLKYNKNLVICQNYLNANPALADSLQVDMFSALGELSLTWKGKNPVNLADGSTLVELSFASLNNGQDSLKWDISPGICTFLDSLGNSITPEFKQGLVRVYSIPEATINDPGPVCEGSDLLLLAQYQHGTGNGTISYQWTGPDGTTGSDPLFYLDKMQSSQAGNWTLTVSDTNHCQSSTSVEVNIIPLPVSGFPADKDTLWFDEMTRLEALPGYASYRWNTGDSTSSILVTSEGWYKVIMQTEEGCTSADSLMMLYSFAPFTMPNAFTPDGDGINDVFRPVTVPEKVESFSMYIFDRWGRQIFATKDLGAGWNGKINGNPAPLGVYTYIINYSNSAGETKKNSGVVTLLR